MNPDPSSTPFLQAPQEIFVISRALLLRKISAGSGDETIEKYSISLKYPAE
jgi:hypothetical protein